MDDVEIDDATSAFNAATYTDSLEVYLSAYLLVEYGPERFRAVDHNPAIPADTELEKLTVFTGPMTYNIRGIWWQASPAPQNGVAIRTGDRPELRLTEWRLAPKVPDLQRPDEHIRKLPKSQCYHDPAVLEQVRSEGSASAW